MYEEMQRANAAMNEVSRETKKVVKETNTEREKGLAAAKKLLEELDKEYAKSSQRTTSELITIEKTRYQKELATLKAHSKAKEMTEEAYQKAVQQSTELHEQRIRDIYNKHYEQQIKEYKAFANSKTAVLQQTYKEADAGRQREIQQLQESLKVQDNIIEKRKIEAQIALKQAENEIAKMQEKSEILAKQEEALSQILNTERLKDPVDPTVIEELQTAIDAVRLNSAELQNDIHTATEEMSELLDTDAAALEGYLETFSMMSDQMSDFVDDLTSIGDGLSSNWSKVFKSMSKGIDEVSKALKSGEKGFKKWAGVASQAAGTIASVFGALADEQNQQTKEGFESYKKLSVAQAVMSTLSAVINGWSSAMQLPYPANIVAGGVLTGMSTALGAVQVSKIRKMQFEGGEDAGSLSASVPSASSASPSGAVIQNTVQAPVQWTSEVQGMSQESSVKDTRVYVLESDITSVQNRVNVQESESTF